MILVCVSPNIILANISSYTVTIFMYGRRQGTISAHFSEITLGIGGGGYVRISKFFVINLSISSFFVILINLKYIRSCIADRVPLQD